MKIIKQTLFKIELSRPQTEWNSVFYVEADSLEEALSITREIMKNSYKEWEVHSVSTYAPLFKSLTKTVTIEV